ncbi:tetratricopeptide repeat protein [Novosphingobium sp. FKTRR1]|uniref:tetratricopeptide repeat protein n=1 Tax=Novosphingobium sp. FKTRR1 TaxID=2879118 RepID=UPI001CF09036|nr:tetratricopeptide repeat protein [Novosphingobium sp. FKTRR1]
MTDFDPQSATHSPDAKGSGVGAGVGVGVGGDDTGGGSRARLPRWALFGAAAVAVAAAGSMAFNRGEKAQVAVVAPPEPVSSEAPVVDDVITRLETRLKDAPDDADAWRKLGWSHFQTGDYAAAATALRKANKLDPTHAETYSFLGESLVLASKREGRIPPEARAAFEKALKLNPKDARARYFRALSLDLGGQHRRAINAWFDQLKDTPPDAPYADDIRKVIRSVGAQHKIEVEKRLAEVQFVPPSAAPTPAAGAKTGGGPGTPAESAKPHGAAKAAATPGK